MSAEEGAAQQPKAAATFTSFINKNTTGKKFAPKAARRRPGPALAAPAPKPPTVETHISQPEPELSIARTPSIQASAAQNTHSAIPGPSEFSTATAAVTATQDLSSAAVESLPTPSLTQPEGRIGELFDTSAVTQALAHSEIIPGPVRDGLLTNRASKRRRVDPPTAAHATAAPGGTEVQEQAEASRPLLYQEGSTIAHQLDGQVLPAEHVPAVESRDQVAEANTVQLQGKHAVILQPRSRRNAPWVAVNHRQDGEDGAAAPTPVKRNRQTAKSGARKGAMADEDSQLQEGNEEDESRHAQEQSSPRIRKTRKKAIATTGEDAEMQPFPKRTRRPRKVKDKILAGNDEVIEGEHEQEAERGEVVPRRKPRQPRGKSRTTEGEDGLNGDGESTQPKRKGRPPREATPSDAEEQTIDPETTFMDGLASRNIRVGKLSSREKEMRQIDWAAVRQRRREEDSRPIKSKEEQEAADKALAEAGADIAAQQTEMGPRFREVDGRIEMIYDSGTINREAAADLEIAEYQVIEDRDITSRITSRSFMKNNKRFPNEFLLPGQGRRWTKEDTDVFYQGLRSFGTDFQMISQMFPGSTRRSIKTKFTREERDAPERVRAALQCRSEMASHWDHFLKASQMEEESFADVDEIKRQMAEDEIRMKELIAAAREETRQRNLQKVAAGVLDGETEGVGTGDKENDKIKGKKKRKGKEKQVTFEEEQGVEIVGSLEDDPTWGQQ